MITTNLPVGRITGTRLHIEGMGSAYAWQPKRPFTLVGVVSVGTIDNSTGVSARKRRHL